MKILIIITVMLFDFANTYPQETYGSFAIACICKDGILLAEDSRCAFRRGIDDNIDNDIAGYFDSLQKIHIIKNFAFCSVGNQNFKPQYNSLFYYLTEFNNSIHNNATVSDGKENFYAFINKNYPNLLEQFLSLKIILGGYENGKPVLVLMQNSEWQSANDGFIVTDTKCNFDKIYNSNSLCEEMAPKIELCIKEYVKNLKKGNTVGGPIMVLKISPENKFSWIINAPQKINYNNLTEIYKDYLSNKIQITFTSADNKINFDKNVRVWLISN